MPTILHLISNLDTGGAEMMLYKLTSFMDKTKFRNIVVSMTDKGTLAERFEKNGITVYTLNLRRGQFSFLAFLSLIKIIKREMPVLIQTWLYHADLLGLIAGSLMKIPVIWNIRCSNVNFNKYRQLTRFVVLLCAKLSRFPNAIITNSRTAIDIHKEYGYKPKMWKVIPNGFDCSVFKPLEDAKDKFLQELKLPTNALLVGLIARYDAMKGHDIFIKAAHKLIGDFDNVYFVLVGRGVNYQNSEIVNMIGDAKERFRLLDERSDISYIMSAMDVIASSSYGEGFPNVVAEAMACGVPCVVTDVGDSAYIVGDTGLVVPPVNHEALANAIKKMLLMDKKERQGLGLKARKRIEMLFSIGAVVKDYEGLYFEVLKKC